MTAISTVAARRGEFPGGSPWEPMSRGDGRFSADRGGHQHAGGVLGRRCWSPAPSPAPMLGSIQRQRAGFQVHVVVVLNNNQGGRVVLPAPFPRPLERRRAATRCGRRMTTWRGSSSRRSLFLWMKSQGMVLDHKGRGRRQPSRARGGSPMPSSEVLASFFCNWDTMLSSQ